MNLKDKNLTKMGKKNALWNILILISQISVFQNLHVVRIVLSEKGKQTEESTDHGAAVRIDFGPDGLHVIEPNSIQFPANYSCRIA